MPSLRATSSRALATRERILVAGRELFSEQGYDQTSTREICRRAQIASGTFFAHFADKRSLLFSLMNEKMQSAIARAHAESSSLTLVTAANRAIDIVCATLNDERKLSRAYMRELLFNNEAAASKTAKVEAGWADLHKLFLGLVERSKAVKEISESVDVTSMAHALFSVFHTTTCAWLGGALPSNQVRAQLARAMVDLVSREPTRRIRVDSTPPTKLERAHPRAEIALLRRA